MIDSFVLYMLMPEAHVCIVIDMPGSPPTDGKSRLRTPFNDKAVKPPSLLLPDGLITFQKG